MSDRYLVDPKLVAPATVKGTPDMGEELKYRLQEERGKHVALGKQFKKKYPANSAGPRKRNDFDPEMFGVKR
jgi:hypothetical protein